MEIRLLCTIHNFKFGFERPPEGIEPALLRCHICSNEERDRMHKKIAELEGHRDALLKAIDLKQTLQPN